MRLAEGDALVVVDIQKDFLPGGALPVMNGNRIIEPINRLIELFKRNHLSIFASRDWHPPNHCSFQAQGGPWPPHCVANTPGAEFAEALKLDPSIQVVSKATSADREAYSCLDRTGLEERLRAVGARRMFIAGLTTEYCVFYSVRDAVRMGFEIFVIDDAIGALSQDPIEVDMLEQKMREMGGRFVESSEVEGRMSKAV